MGAPPLVGWHAHATAVLGVHMVWCTHRRAPWIDVRMDAWLAHVLARKARAIDCLVVAVGNADDHVHVIVRHPPRVSVAQIAHRLKGASSRLLHCYWPHTEGLTWQAGYWAESITPSATEPLIAYVLNQRSHHATSAAPEPWERRAE